MLLSNLFLATTIQACPILLLYVHALFVQHNFNSMLKAPWDPTCDWPFVCAFLGTILKAASPALRNFLWQPLSCALHFVVKHKKMAEPCRAYWIPFHKSPKTSDKENLGKDFKEETCGTNFVSKLIGWNSSCKSKTKTKILLNCSVALTSRGWKSPNHVFVEPFFCQVCPTYWKQPALLWSFQSSSYSYLILILVFKFLYY